jgi:squalene-hopene/tetraprenyl-beta-curcumene cyclase
LLALVAAGHGSTEAARRGVDYLVRTQEADGSWEEREFTATGFPGYGEGVRRFNRLEGDPEEVLPPELPAGFMIKYHAYRLCWPLLALGRYRAAVIHDER